MRSVLCAVAGLAVLAACTEDGQPDQNAGTRASTTPTLEGYATMDRTAFVQAIEDQLAAINRDLTVLEDRAGRAGSPANQEVKAAMESIPQKRDALRQKLSEFKDSVAEASDAVRKELVESCRNLQDALKRAMEKVS